MRNQAFNCVYHIRFSMSVKLKVRSRKRLEVGLTKKADFSWNLQMPLGPVKDLTRVSLKNTVLWEIKLLQLDFKVLPVFVKARKLICLMYICIQQSLFHIPKIFWTDRKAPVCFKTFLNGFTEL